MTVTTFKQHAEAAKKTDRETWLGSLLWYTVSETRVSFSDLEQALKDSGLKDFVPRKPRDEDVFRRVAPNGHKRRIASSVPDVHVNYRIHQVKRGGGVCVKQIVMETVDTAGEVLQFLPVYEMRYVEGSGGDDLSVHSLVTPVDTVAEVIADEIVADYQANRGWVDATAIRTIIRRVMESCKATNVRPTGGVYFVMSAYASTVDSLEEFAQRIDGSQVHSLPLISDDKQREMVRRAYEAESVGEIEALMQQVSGILGDPTIKMNTKKYAALSAQFTHALSKTKDYEHLLEDTLDLTNDKLDLLQTGMAQLLMRVTE